VKLNRQEFLSISGVDHETLDAWIAEEWLIPDSSSADVSFRDIDVARARLIRDLKMDLGVNDAGVGVVLHLLDQLHSLRRTFKQVRDVIGTKPPE
jgi:chaperone modulatory protein CbpM